MESMSQNTSMDEALTRSLIVSSVNAFPAISPTANSLLVLLAKPNANAADVERAVRYDPGLTANILKLANSAYFGIPGGIASVSQAVTRVGWRRMYQLTVAATVNAMMEKPVPGYQLAPGALWRHSVAVAVAAETLARENGLQMPEETFTAALLHDAGKLVMGKFVEPYFDLIEMAVSRGLSFDQAEREVLATDHAEVGAWVLEHWSLPAGIVEAVRCHHRPDAASPRSLLIDVVHLADVFCLILGIGVGNDGIQYMPSMGAMARLGLKPDRMRSAADRTLRGVEELCTALAG